jgi:CheY-like chemotaxis protein
LEPPGAGRRPIRDFMDGAPSIADVETPAEAFVQQMLADCPQALLNGVIVTDAAGRYLGVANAVSLLAARTLHAPGESAGLIEQIASDVREPMQAALAAADQLLQLRLPDGARAYLDVIAEAGSAVTSLLETASDLKNAEMGRFALACEPRRLQELMDDVEGRWRTRAEAAGARLMVSYDGDPDCAAQVDAPRLLQVFDALIGHALAHVRHGVVEASLKTRGAEGGVAVSGAVRDNGARYTAEYLARLFDSDGPASAAGDLTVRLGLALAGRAMEAMGGTLAAEANVGAGATMAFEMTLKAGGHEAVEPSGRTGAARAAHILVVDDNATNRMVVEALCEMFDCSTESVIDGVEAVEAARGGHFDIILMDIKMPRMDGVAATREIRKLRGPAAKTPIIALTANADPDEVSEYLAAGMCSVVEKPIKPERLMEALDAVLSAPAPAAARKGAAAA